MAKREIEIVGGPSKSDMSGALFENSEEPGRNVVSFQLTGFQSQLECRLLGIAAEDGSRESWILSLQLETDHENLKAGNYQVYYRSDTGHGYLTFDEK